MSDAATHTSDDARDHVPPERGRRGRRSVAALLAHQKHVYEQGEERPVGSYAAISGVFVAAAGALTALARHRRVPVPAAVPWGDAAVITLATAQLSRIIAKDPITSPLRMPFTRFEGRSGPAELAEEVRGVGPRHAVGELITCPFCLTPWLATALVGGSLLAPRFTRVVALTGAVVAGADALQFAISAMQRADEEA